MNNLNKMAFVIILLLIGCSQQKESLLKTNKTFDENETLQLLTFLEDFDEVIADIEKKGSKKISKNYKSLFEKLKLQSAEGILNIGIEEATQVRLEGHLDKELSKELWMNMKWSSVNRIELKDTVLHPVLKAEGKLFELMENEVAPKHPVIQECVNKMNIVGAMSPAVFADILMFPEKYNIEDDRVRLFIAIHYLGYNRGNLNDEKALKQLE